MVETAEILAVHYSNPDLDDLDLLISSDLCEICAECAGDELDDLYCEENAGA